MSDCAWKSVHRGFERTGLLKGPRLVWDPTQSAAKCNEITFSVAVALCRPWEVCAANLCRSFQGRCLSQGYATTGFLAVRPD